MESMYVPARSRKRRKMWDDGWLRGEVDVHTDESLLCVIVPEEDPYVVIGHVVSLHHVQVNVVLRIDVEGEGSSVVRGF